jgi:tetratricopeptide (TPR) repeat protein
MKPYKISPKQTAALQNAITQHNQGQLDQADEVYRKFLREVPNHPDALHLRALVAHARGNFADAAKFAEAAIAVAPRIANFHNTAGEAWRRQQQTRQALKRLTAATKLDPAFAMAHHNLSLALCEEGRYSEALESCRMALSLNPSYLEAKIASLEILGLMGDLAHGEAEAALLARNRDSRTACDAAATYHTRRARAHLERIQLAEARVEGRKAVSASPWFWGGWAILGEVGNELFDRDSAELFCCIAATLAPANKDARLNLAHLLREQQRLEEAGSHYSAWLKDHAADANAHFGLAVVHLARGNYAAGWPEYEHRWAVAGGTKKLDNVPAWTGGATGKLIIYPEQGLGDFLQMLRFVPEAARRCKGEVTVLAPAPLARLVRRNLAAAAVECVVRGSPPDDAQLLARKLRQDILESEVAAATRPSSRADVTRFCRPSLFPAGKAGSSPGRRDRSCRRSEARSGPPPTAASFTGGSARAASRASGMDSGIAAIRRQRSFDWETPSR